MQFVSRKRRNPRHVEGVVLRNGDRSQRLDQAYPTEKLHAPAVRDVHLGMRGGRSISFDQHASHPPLGQIARDRHPDGTSPNNKNGYLLHALHPI
jgi:hypothetical protein